MRGKLTIVRPRERVPSAGYISAREPNGPACSRISVLLLLSREPCPHVPVQHAAGEAKVWLRPHVELAQNYGLSGTRVATALRLVEEHYDRIYAAWVEHFGR